jgi:flagellar motor switch protein FliM
MKDLKALSESVATFARDKRLDILAPKPETSAQLSEGQLQKAQTLFEDFLQNFALTLSVYLQFPAKVSAPAASVRDYAAHLGDAIPACAISINLDRDASGVLEFTKSLVIPVINGLLGASDTVEQDDERTITEIEKRLIEGLIDVVLPGLQQTLGNAMGAECAIRAMEVNSRATGLMKRDEALLELSGTVQLGQSVGTLTLFLPLAAAQRLPGEDAPRKIQENQTKRPKPGEMIKALRRSAVEIEARLTGQRILIENLMELKPGQVLNFSHGADQSIDAVVNGKSLCKGKLVSTGKRLAFTVEELAGGPSNGSRTY